MNTLAPIFLIFMSSALNQRAADADMSHAIAQKILQAAVKKSEELNEKMSIAVVDKGANLVGFLRMTGAWLGSVDIAIKKAKTAMFFNMNTEKIGSLSQPGGSLYNIEHSNGGLITFPGGIPLDGHGAVGVSGASVESDKLVAEAALAAFQKYKKYKNL